MGNWPDFFSAELGAAADLTGLVIVGISINVTRILSEPALLGRAAETLVLPAGILMCATFALVPLQPDWLLGGELVLTGAVMWAVPLRVHVQALQTGSGIGPAGGRPRFALAFLSSWPFIISGILLFLHIGGAFYWCVSGIVVATIATVINAWVLLVEILR